MFENEKYDVLYKVVLVGDAGVGKSNLTRYFTSNEKEEYTADNDSDATVDSFNEMQVPTIGVEFGTQCIIHPKTGETIKCQVWDTAGQERYRAITSSHYRRADGALVVYDVTNRKSFENIRNHWIPELKAVAEDGCELTSCIMLVGNKIDLIPTDDSTSSSCVSTEEQESLAKNLRLCEIRTSAKSGANICKAFEDLVVRIHDVYQAKGGKTSRGRCVTLTNTIESESSGRSGCC